MSNSTTKPAPFYDLGLGFPLWVVIVWIAAGVIIIVMVVLVFYVCFTRKKSHRHDRQTAETGREERRDSAGMFEIYPRGIIDELHNQEQHTKHIFPPSFVDNMRIPRAMEVKIVESVNELNTSFPPQYPDFSYQSYQFPEESTNNRLSVNVKHFEDDDASSSRVTLSREASFKQSNISEENRVKQLYREKMLVNELREKLRKERRIIEEDDYSDG